MDVKLTPEVASAHKNLTELCEKFGTSVDKLCTVSPWSLRTKDFHESECVPIAVECVDTLFKFQSACSHEVTFYENEVAGAKITLKHRKQESAGNRAKEERTYRNEVTNAKTTLIDRKHSIEGRANEKIEEAELEYDRQCSAFVSANCVKYFLGSVIVTTAIICGIHFFFSDFAARIIGFSFSVFVPAIVARIRYRKKKNEVVAELSSIGKEKRDIIQKEMQKEIKQVEVELDKKLNEAGLKRDREVQQSKDDTTSAVAEYDRKIHDALLRRNQAIAFIKQEYHTFDTRFCQFLDQLQSFADAWMVANTANRSNEDQPQNLNQDGERIYSRLPRVGTISIWNILGRNSGIDPVNENHQAARQEILETIEAANEGEAEAQYKVGLIYSGLRTQKIDHGKIHPAFIDSGDGTLIDIQQGDTEAVKWYQKAAEQGHVDAQYNLGVMYQKGRGMKKNHTEAVKWYQKAAEQGHVDAQYNLGAVYGRAKWYQKAAEQGHVDAQYNLGAMYETGKGVPQDYHEAVKWYQKAAEQGHVDAQYNLGAIINEYSRGEKKNYAEAVKWYKKAAEQGHADAQVNLGAMYETGRGVPQDSHEAVKWYKKAVEQGHIGALFGLGALYEKGYNNVEAAKCYRKYLAKQENSSTTARSRTAARSRLERLERVEEGRIFDEY